MDPPAEAEVIPGAEEFKAELLSLSRKITSIKRSIHVGPLPPAEELKKYEQALKGAADRILAMAESEQAHGQSMDREALAADRDIARRGQNYALAATVSLGGMGMVLGILGAEKTAIAFVVAGCVPIVAHFLGFRTSGTKESSRPESHGSESSKVDSASSTRSLPGSSSSKTSDSLKT